MVVKPAKITPIIYGWEIEPDDRKDFDYLSDEEMLDATFFRYNDNLVYMGNIMRLEDQTDYDGYESWSAFNGIFVTYCDEDGERNSNGISFGEYVKINYFYQ